jgi:hypothetical protein
VIVFPAPAMCVHMEFTVPPIYDKADLEIIHKVLAQA